MPELTTQERLQPALLDRLTDLEPDKKEEPVERRVMSKTQLRQAVLRDLAWLFNTTRHEAGVDPETDLPRRDLSNAPRVRTSVINYGLPALSGRPATMLELRELERSIRQAIITYEPRILPDSLEVKSLVTKEDDLSKVNVVGLQIRGQLWAQPVPLELLLRTEIELETGKVEVGEMRRGRVP